MMVALGLLFLTGLALVAAALIDHYAPEEPEPVEPDPLFV